MVGEVGCDFLQFQQIGGDVQASQLNSTCLVLAVEPAKPLKSLVQLMHVLHHHVRVGTNSALSDVRHHQQDDHLKVLCYKHSYTPVFLDPEGTLLEVGQVVSAFLHVLVRLEQVGVDLADLGRVEGGLHVVNFEQILYVEEN